MKHGVYEIQLESTCNGITTYPKGWRIWIDGNNYGFHLDRKEATDRFERLTNPDGLRLVDAEGESDEN